MHRLRTLYIGFVKICVGLLLIVSSVAVVAYYRDSSRLSRLSHELTAQDKTEDEKIATIASFVTNLEGKLGDDDYFLLPVFAPLKPSACQVIDGGGDCAFRARAFIVLMRTLDVHASKLCLHDAKGVPRHAVAIVDTAQGPLIVDLLFGIIYRHDDGTPMTVDYIAEHHEKIVKEHIRRGNTRAEKYPFERYPYDRVTTINWEKSFAWRSLRSLLGLFMSEESIHNIPRPYVAEEPALMIVIASGLAVFVLLLPIFTVRIVRRLALIASSPAQ